MNQKLLFMLCAVLAQFSFSCFATNDTSIGLHKNGLYLQNGILNLVANPGIDESARFYNNTNIRIVKVFDHVTAIGKMDFIECQNLETVDISRDSKLETIGDYAFANCSKLKSIRIPKDVMFIGKEAFMGCTALKEVIVDTEHIPNIEACFPKSATIILPKKEKPVTSKRRKFVRNIGKFFKKIKH